MSLVGNPWLMKQLNRSAILGLVRERGPLSRADIAKHLNVSASTVTRIVTQLIEEQLLIEDDGTSEHNHVIGRRPTLLRFNFMANVVIGVDVGGTQTTGAVADLHGDILHRHSAPSVPDGDPTRSLPFLLDFIESLVEAAPMPPDKVRGIGVAVPSYVRDQEGTVAWAPALGWRDEPLKQLIEDRVGLPTFVENDVNLAALGESQYGIGRGVQHLVCIFCGTGIGGGLVLNGQLYRGQRGAAGEVGYMVPQPHLLERCRSYEHDFGCLEGLASGPGVARRAQEALRAGAASSLRSNGASLDAVTAKKVFQAAREGDPVAQDIVRDTVNYLGQAVANVSSTLDPEMVILGGALTRSDDLLLEPIKERVSRAVPFAPDIVLSELGDDAVLSGAIALAIRATREDIAVSEAAA